VAPLLEQQAWPQPRSPFCLTNDPCSTSALAAPCTILPAPTLMIRIVDIIYRDLQLNTYSLNRKQAWPQPRYPCTTHRRNGGAL
jgi:hypothetical protein